MELVPLESGLEESVDSNGVEEAVVSGVMVEVVGGVELASVLVLPEE